MPTELPQGRYLSCAFGVAASAGGQTRAMLMRARILAQLGGVLPSVLTLGPAPDIPERREQLHEHGLLLPEMPYLNIYEHYRDHGWGDQEPIGELDDLGPHKTGEATTAGGAPWRAVYRPPGSKRPIFEYLRADGSPYLRIARYNKGRSRSWPHRIQQIGPNGELVGEFQTLGQWFRRWIRELLQGERAFVFIDSRFVVPHLVPMRGSDIHLIYQMHNVHVGPPRRWDSEMNRVYRRALRRVAGMDAMVTLTERQRDDIAARRGRTTNLFVVPNTVPLPEPPAHPAPRDPLQATIVARLEGQKRLTHAIAAFEEVVAAVPGAHLDIYGDGSERERLQEEIDARGLDGAIRLRGFDPRASDRLFTSTAFLMTSAFEGYPLSTIESMSRGCPVVSYDIKYGPREQITDGVDGFLVPAGDRHRLAERVTELLLDPELARRMGAAAVERVRRYGPAEFLATWAGVLETVVREKPLRTEIDDVELQLDRLRLAGSKPPIRLPDRGPAFALGAVAAGQALELRAALKLRGRSRRSGMRAVRLELAWIEDATGEVTDLPLRVRRVRNTFRLRARAAIPDADARLRLRLTWRNSAWETEVARLRDGVLTRRRVK